MRLSQFKLSVVAGLAALAFFTTACPALANVVEVPPPVMEDGKLATYSRVKKNGQIWYPASVVGYHRKIKFAYDHATHTLFANGVETELETVVVDQVVYVNLTPKVSHSDMRPGMDYLAQRRAYLESTEGASPHMEGNTAALFMSENVGTHPHPWVEQPGARNGPLIDLDPTSEARLAPHMRPGARPPEAPPEALPNRLPRPGEGGSTSNSRSTVEATTNTGTTASSGIPARVTSEGGPSGSTGDTSGLMPIPKAPEKAPDTNPFRNSGQIRAQLAKNSVFQVRINSGTWQVNKADRIMRVKLSQQNISRVAQSNLGSFSVRCSDGTRVEASRTRSYLPDGTLDPGGAREGNLVFRFSAAQEPKALELEGALKVSVPLQMQ